MIQTELDNVLSVHNSNVSVDRRIIGIKLRKLRRNLGLKKQEIADIWSISRVCYSHYEIGLSLITTLILYTLCKTYKLSIDEFLR